MEQNQSLINIIEYHWVELWPTLTSVLHFNVLRLEDLQQKEEFGLYLGSVNISYTSSFAFTYPQKKFISVFNMCVTYGETFLSDTKSYDRLYYEIIRATTDFIKLSEYGNIKTDLKKKPALNFFLS